MFNQQPTSYLYTSYLFIMNIYHEKKSFISDLRQMRHSTYLWNFSSPNGCSYTNSGRSCCKTLPVHEPMEKHVTVRAQGSKYPAQPCLADDTMLYRWIFSKCNMVPKDLAESEPWGQVIFYFIDVNRWVDRKKWKYIMQVPCCFLYLIK